MSESVMFLVVSPKDFLGRSSSCYIYEFINYFCWVINKHHLINVTSSTLNLLKHILHFIHPSKFNTILDTSREKKWSHFQGI
jgi:hypothetical protein